MMSARMLRRATRGLTEFLRSDDPSGYQAEQRRKEEPNAQREEETPIKTIRYDFRARTVTETRPGQEPSSTQRRPYKAG
jgi:hypothetical protein